MLICRYQNGSQQKYGAVADGEIYDLVGELFGSDLKRGKRIGSAGDFKLLPPVSPSKIICVGRNYAAHAQEKGNEVPVEPLLFFKPPSALVGHRDAIELLPDMGRVEHEAELAFIIGKPGRNIPQHESLSHILGFTCANDVSERDYQAKDGQWTRAKGFDTFCPLGPWISTNVESSSLNIQCAVNGVVRQQANTNQLVFDVPFLVTYISRIMTLHAGDVVLTGTPAGVGPIISGDQVDVEIEQIGVLSNSVTLTS